MKIIFRFVPLLVCLALATLSCKKDENPASASNQLVGNWNPQSATVNGTATPVSTALNWNPNAVSALLTINANGTFVYTEHDAANAAVYTAGGTFSVNGNSVTLTYTSENGQPVNPPSTQTLTCTVTGTQLTVTTTQGGDTVVILYVRS